MGIEPSQCAALKHVKILAYTMATENTNNKSHTKTVNWAHKIDTKCRRFGRCLTKHGRLLFAESQHFKDFLLERPVLGGSRHKGWLSHQSLWVTVIARCFSLPKYVLVVFPPLVMILNSIIRENKSICCSRPKDRQMCVLFGCFQSIDNMSSSHF